MAEIKSTIRTINYFAVSPTFIGKQSIKEFNSIFDIISDLNKKKDKKRFVKNGDKLLNLVVSKIDDTSKKIYGKVLNIRMDNFPEILKTTDDKIRDIEVDDDEGILETSHFILSYSKNKLILALEHNQYGPRVSDFHYFINSFLTRNQIVSYLIIDPLTNDIVIDYGKRINKISFFIAKVHKDNVGRMEKYSKGVFSALKTASTISESEYLTIQFNIDTRKAAKTTKLKNLVLKIASTFSKNNKSNEDFETLKIKAEDTENGNRIKDFDLLNVWIKSVLKVDKKPNSRVIVSIDIFDKMAKDFHIQIKNV